MSVQGHCCLLIELQEAQLMLTHPRDAVIGHSRSPNIVPFQP